MTNDQTSEPQRMCWEQVKVRRNGQGNHKAITTEWRQIPYDETRHAKRTTAKGVIMSYLNVGARHHGGYRIQAKKHLKEYLKADPASVTFDPTSMFDDQTEFDGAHIPEGSKLTVVGPDPYSNRKWFATVERTAKGIKVS